MANNHLSEESYLIPDYSDWDVLGGNGLGWKKRVTVGEEWGKEEMQKRLYELFPRHKECQGKYSFYLKKTERSLELKFASSRFVSGLVVSSTIISEADELEMLGLCTQWTVIKQNFIHFQSAFLHIKFSF